MNSVLDAKSINNIGYVAWCVIKITAQLEQGGLKAYGVCLKTNIMKFMKVFSSLFEGMFLYRGDKY